MTLETADSHCDVAAKENSPGGLHRFAVAIAVVTFVAVVLGGAVTSTDSSLADPHWPSFGGRWYPDLSRMLDHPGLFLEHGHRLLIGVVGISVVVLAFLLFLPGGNRGREGMSRSELGKVRSLSVAAVVLVIVAAVLGGLTVRWGKSTPLSIVHSGIAMLIVSVVVSLAVTTGPRWFSEPTRLEARSARRLLAFCVAALGTVYVQIILGAIPRHATEEVGGSRLVLIGDAIHIVWAFVVFGVLIVTFLEMNRELRKVGPVFRPALVLILLLVVQLFLGLSAFVTQPKDPPSREVLAAAAETDRKGPAETLPRSSSGVHELSASTHQAVGVLMLITSVVLTLRTGRIYNLSVRPAGPARDRENSEGSV